MRRHDAIEALKYLISDECTDNQFDYIDEIRMAITDMKICEANNGDWISVKDRLPEAEGRYLVFYGDAVFLKFGIFDDKDCINIDRWSQKHMKWWDIEFNREIQNITHWMLLPEPPEEEDDAGT